MEDGKHYTVNSLYKQSKKKSCNFSCNLSKWSSVLVLVVKSHFGKMLWDDTPSIISPESYILLWRICRKDEPIYKDSSCCQAESQI